MKEKLKGKWRTYKLFCFSGKLEHHHDSFYSELLVTDENTLTFFHSEAKREKLILKEDEWTVENQKKCCYIMAGKKKLFEIITLESNDLVLIHVLSGDKLFLHL
jgi:hypothetical protein